MSAPEPAFPFQHRHCLDILQFSRPDIDFLLDLGAHYLRTDRPRRVLKRATVVNLFFENSTRTEKSFEIAAKRLGADVVNMNVATSSVAKGETLLDTAATLNAMRPDVLVVRHGASGAPALLAQKVSGGVVNAGDGTHAHPTQALLDALTLRGRVGEIGGKRVAICGDILHSRVARSNVELLTLLGAQVRLVGPPTLIPPGAASWGVEVFHSLEAGLAGCDVVMMLRLQLERMRGAFVPSQREYFHFHGLDHAKLALAKPGAVVMHPGPMNRGVEISSRLADDPEVSLVTNQVEAGVAMRMALLDALTRHGRQQAKQAA